MAKPDEISSTEKLLDYIRRDGPAPEKGGESPPSRPSRMAKILSFPFFQYGKVATVGVHIGETALRFIKIKREGGGSATIAGFKTISYKPPIFPDHEEFPRFLKNAITDFCGPSGHCELWSTLASDAVAVRYLKLPNVSKKEVPNAAFWTFKKEAPFEDAESVFDYEILGEIMDDGVQKLEVLGCLAEKAEVTRISRIFEKSEYPLNGLTTPAVGFLNFLKNGWIDTRGDNICTLHIEKESSRIDIFKSSGSLVLSRDIRTGANSMIDAISQEAEIQAKLESQKGADSDASQETLSIKPSIQPADLKGNGLLSEMNHYISQMGEEAVFRLILPTLDRLTRQVERTLKHFSLHHNNEAVNQVFISGDIANFERITRYMGDALGLPIHRADPFKIAGDEITRPMQGADRIAYSTAAGAALCDSIHSPNFLYSQTEKDTLNKANRSSRLILYGFLGLMVGCFVYYLWQEQLIRQKKRDIEALSTELKHFSPQLDKPDLLKLMNDANAKRQELRSYAEKYTGLALVSDLAHRVHPAVRLLHMDLVIPLKEKAKEPGTAEKKTGTQKDKAPEPRILKVEGIVLGSRANFESDLTEYLIGLKNSLLLSNPKVEKRTYEYFENEEVLRFTATLDVV